jgi:phosphohistidine swiveling domain-containing protein
MTIGTERALQRDAWDPLMGASRPDWYWTTTNVSEALPGVLTPLMWTLWGPSIEHAPRESAYLIGGLTEAERHVPARAEERYTQVFYGRAALRLDFTATVADRVPGTTGPAAVRSMFGSVPEDMEFHPTKRRYPIVAVRMPLLFIRFPRMLAALSADIDAWWKASIARLPSLDRAGAQAMFTEAVRRHDEAMVMQTNGILSTMQVLYDSVESLVVKAGAGELSVLTGASGGAEMAVVTDIWRASRGEITLEEIVRNHGFHGPNEGELSSTVWREDPAPLTKLVEQYKSRPDSQDPRMRDHERAAHYDREAAAVVAALPAPQRPGARLVLKLARGRLPLRGVGKRAFLQANDMARASARALGHFLVADGLLEAPDDIFYLTVEEVTAARLPDDAKTLVARRRERRTEYQRVTLPDKWKGTPTPIPVQRDGDEAPAPLAAGDVVQGVGVSTGVVEGVVRVVTDPSFAEVEPDEILVAPLTDPSWSSIMFISSALVVDIGGALSHAAVVARELDIPCVVGTQDGSQRLLTGDRVRVDGKAGTVQLLARAGAGEPAQ